MSIAIIMRMSALLAPSAIEYRKANRNQLTQFFEQKTPHVLKMLADNASALNFVIGPPAKTLGSQLVDTKAVPLNRSNRSTVLVERGVNKVKALGGKSISLVGVTSRVSSSEVDNQVNEIYTTGRLPWIMNTSFSLDDETQEDMEVELLKSLRVNNVLIVQPTSSDFLGAQATALPLAQRLGRKFFVGMFMLRPESHDWLSNVINASSTTAWRGLGVERVPCE